ncbi:MAG: sugar transferase [bacterium]
MMTKSSVHKIIVRESALWLVAVDVLCLAASIALGVKSRGWLGPSLGMDPLEIGSGEYIKSHPEGWIFFCVTVMIANYIVGNYKLQAIVYRFNLFVNWLFSLAAGLLVLSATSMAWFELMLGRGVLLFAIAAYAFLSLIVKCIVYELLPKSELFVRRTVLFGTGKGAQDVRRIVESKYIIPRHMVCGHVFVPVEGVEPHDCSPEMEGTEIVCTTVDKMEDTMRVLDSDLIIMCSDNVDEVTKCLPVMRRLRFSGIEVMDRLSAIELFSGRVPLDMANDAWMMQATMAPSMASVRRIKRLFDIVITCLTLLVVVPASLIVGLLLKLSAPGSPMFYTQTRVGQFGRLFRMHKFRTMVVDAEKHVGPVWAQRNDPRVTRLGRVLRKFRLDEMPQIWNVLLGEMSLVGPRPERPEIVAELQKQIPNYRERENVPPGVTGWAQVRFPYVDTVEDVARKLEFDFYYIKNMSVRLDFQIILMTIRIVLLGKERNG